MPVCEGKALTFEELQALYPRPASPAVAVTVEMLEQETNVLRMQVRRMDLQARRMVDAIREAEFRVARLEVRGLAVAPGPNRGTG